MALAKKHPLVSVVILNWNRYEDTVLCLQYVRQLSYPNIEIVVVDNGSTDGSKDKLPSETDIVYVDNPTNRGFTGGHIDGLAASHGNFILLLNNDALIRPDYVDQALTHFVDESVAVVGGRAYQWDDQLPAFKTSNPFYGYQVVNPYSGEGLFVQSDNGHVLEVNNVSGSAVLVRRSVIDKVGYLYEPFFAYFEETDLFARIKRAGYKVLYDPGLHIWHKGGASSTSYFQFYQLFRNRFIFAVRNFQPGYFHKFLYIYARIGISSFVRQWQPGEQQVMRKAYAKASLHAWLSLPKHLIERRQLTRALGVNHYNEQLEREVCNVSFLVDLDSRPVAEHANVISKWIAAIEQHPRHEIVFITADEAVRAATEKAITNHAIFAKVAFDRRQIDTHSLNIGWLSSKYPWVYVSDSAETPTISAIEHKVAKMNKQATSVLLFKDKDALSQTAVYDRRFLIQTGGFMAKLDLPLAKAHLYSLANLSQPHIMKAPLSLIDVTSSRLKIPTDSSFTTLVSQSISLDAHTLHQPTRWDVFMTRHRHIGQLASFLRWLLSPRIALRLKVSRLRNLVLFGVRLQRKAIATELRHIVNEDRRAHRPNSSELVIQDATEESLRHYREHPNDIPVFIICRDRISTLSQLLKRLDYFGLSNIILIDNDSAFPPLLEYYRTTPFQVIQTGQNVGHKSPWESGFIKTLAPESFYIVTDPDVIPVEACPQDAISHLLELHGKYQYHQKVGFGLKIDDLPDHYIHKEAVITWESQFWLNSLEPDVYEVPLDTTFALYKPFNYQYFLHPSIRTGGNFVARHLPWYVDHTAVDAEEQYYRDRASGAVTSWTVETLDDTLQKELAKQPKQEIDEVV